MKSLTEKVLMSYSIKKIEEVNEEEQKQKVAKEEADRTEKVEKTSSNNNSKAPAKRSGQNPLIKNGNKCYLLYEVY